jgi:hypothetical protein
MDALIEASRRSSDPTIAIKRIPDFVPSIRLVTNWQSMELLANACE